MDRRAILLLSLWSSTHGWGVPRTSVRFVATQRRARNAPFDDYHDDYDNDYYDYYNKEDTDDELRNRRRRSRDTSRRNYWEDPSEDNGSPSRRCSNDDDDDYYYLDDDYYSSNEDRSSTYQDDVLEWESCETPDGTAHIVLPPPSVEQPTTILHFVGGTFFGSAPHIWYRQLLEDLVRHTQAVVVATSIPVTLRRPLEHVALATRVQRQFAAALEQVVVDEYGPDIIKNDSAVPICAVGHSLGARLLVVWETLQRQTPSAKAFVLISFINHGAGAGIPGVTELRKSNRRIQEQQQQASPQSRRKARDWLDDDDEWEDIFQDVKDSLQEQTLRVRQALTPDAQNLEFHPSPSQLWQALDRDQRYRIPQTLVVQFDDDVLDQTAALTNRINKHNQTDVKYARLRGTHLTPVSSDHHQSRSNQNDGLFANLNSRAGFLISQVMGRRDKKTTEANLLDLRQSLSRYVTEVVTKN